MRADERDDWKVKMRTGFLSYARPTLRVFDKVSTTEDWEALMQAWFDHEDRALWEAYEAGWNHSRGIWIKEYDYLKEIESDVLETFNEGKAKTLKESNE